MLEKIGGGAEGFKDGDYASAQFRDPQGVLLAYPFLYVTDTGNHALRRVDLAQRIVTTLAGTGTQGFERSVHDTPALKASLSSPWDLAFYPDEKHIVIAMAGLHQLWSYDIAAQSVSVIAGSGEESIEDGVYPNNSLSQPSGLSAVGGKLYFVDAETSSLRVLEKGAVTTLIGHGLFDFGYKKGGRDEARMQHPLGLCADGSAVYIADSYNHSLRRFDPSSGRLSDFAGHDSLGDKDGALAQAEIQRAQRRAEA